MKINLVGPSYQMKSLPFDAQRTVNLFPVTDEMGKEVSALYGTPGLTKIASVGTGPGRRAFCAANDRAFIVSGAALYELNSDYTSTLRGALAASTGNVSMAENGLQLGVCDGGSLYMFKYSDNSFTKVTSGLPSSIAYITAIDGYFVAVETNTGHFYISSNLDGTTWDALDFATAESNPDNLSAAENAAGQLYLLGTRTFEIWTNTGASAFPFQRISGAIGSAGIMAPHTLCVVDNSAVWVGKDKYGNGNVYITQGFRPQRISTEAIEVILNHVEDADEMRAYVYQDEGHTFYVITGGGLETSLVYDFTTQMWHERAHRSNSGEFEQHLAFDHMFAFGTHIVVDRTNNNVYEMSMDVYDDDGEEIVRERTYTHIGDENKLIRYNGLELSMETGVGLQSGQGSNPLVSLQLSKDGARTWSDWQTASIGAVGDYQKRVIFRRLGVSWQMTFRIRITDPVKIALTGSYLV